jgi:hypothetical protein
MDPDALFRFPAARQRDPAVEDWVAGGDGVRGLVAPWLSVLRACGPNVRELMHDGRPTLCADDAAFAYVDAHTAHASVGFYFGAALPDPDGLMEGAGKRMRHVKLRLGRMPNDAALTALIAAAYRDIGQRLADARN